MQSELSPFETVFLGLGVSVGFAALLALSFSAMKLLIKWAHGTLVSLIIKLK
jgi:hypothetical protein